MPRKSARMVKIGHVVVHTNGREIKVTDVTPFTHDTLGQMIAITLADGTVWHRTPGAKINVTRTK